MAWPLDMLTTYFAGTTPAIKAADLNAIQSAITDLYKGITTVKTLFADGIGGNPLTQLPGLIVASASVTRISTPSSVAYQGGTVSIGSVVRGWARVSSVGIMRRGYNVFEATRTGLGTYQILFWGTVFTPADAGVWVSVHPYMGIPAVAMAEPSTITSKMAVTVTIVNLAGTPVDREFSVGYYAE